MAFLSRHIHDGHFTPRPADPERVDIPRFNANLQAFNHRWMTRLGDARPYDSAPDRCWRCDAARSETDVGLCPTCHADLTT